MASFPKVDSFLFTSSPVERYTPHAAYGNSKTLGGHRRTVQSVFMPILKTQSYLIN